MVAMGFKTRSFVLTAVFLSLSFQPIEFVSALEWPVQHGILTATFGENRWGHFHDGIDIGGGGQAIHPAADGKVLYTYDEGSDPRALPTGLGSFMVIQHDKQFRTLYAHMQRGSVLRDKPEVTTAEVIGIEGDTGDSLGRHLHFEVIDREKGEVINPLTLLPLLADTRRPIIVSVSIERNKKLIRLSSAPILDGGEVALIVNAYDPSQYVSYFDPMAPYEIEASLNGRELFNVTYNALKDKNGERYLAPSDSRTFDNYYVSRWGVRLGSFRLSSGAARLTVTVRDIVGNESVETFDIVVRAVGQR